MANNNILTYDEACIRMQIDYSDYYDLFLSEKQSFGYCFNSGLDEECLVAYVDFTDPNAYVGNQIVSNTAYTYESAVVTEDYKLYNIGSVGVDNGLIRFDKDTISEEDFFNIYTETTINVTSDINLHLTQVGSNTDKKSALNGKIEYQGSDGAKFDGSYYQGYFQTLCDKYKVLPTEIEDCWHWEFNLKGSGQFFYIGTRAENKWWKYYNHFEDEVAQLDERECGDRNKDVSNYINPLDGYFKDDYMFNDQQQDLLSYFADDYMKSVPAEEIDLSSVSLKDENGDDLGIDLLGNEVMGYFDTDNKFLIFHQGKDAVTVCNYNSADTYTYYYSKYPYKENLFLKMRQGKNKYTICDLKRDREANNTEDKTPYSLFRDLYNNAFSLSVTDEGAVEYKYLTVDCEKIEESASGETPINHAYKIESEKTKDGMVSLDKFNTINVKVKRCGTAGMRLYIYVNGYLNLVSKELPLFQFKNLDDMHEKQEGVPFNISLGGGTQGLKDVVYPDLFKAPCQELVLPLEKEFGQSTFNGNIRNFKFYGCEKEYMEVKSSFLFESRR